MAESPYPGIYWRNGFLWFRFTPHRGAKQIRVSLKTDNPTLAIIQATKIRARPTLEPTARWKQEVEEFITERQREKRFSAASADARQYALISEGLRMNWRRPDDLATAEIQNWYDDLRLKGKPAKRGKGRLKPNENTALTYVGFLRAFCGWLVENGKLRENPVKGVKLFRSRAVARKNFVPRATVQMLIEKCADAGLKFVLYCGFHTGLRKDEIINARPDWFDMDGRLLHVRIRGPGTLGPKDAGWKPKNGRERFVRLSTEFLAFLKSYEGQDPFMLMPRVKKGRSRYRYDPRKPFDAHLARCGVSGVTIHDTRRTFASLKVSAGVSVYVVAKWLGDGIRTTEEHYGHLAPDAGDDIEKGVQSRTIR